MAYANPLPGSLKRKRRRREDKPAISARIILDAGLKGEIGVLSEDLVQDLYPGVRYDDDTGVRLFAALTPWTPTPSLARQSWAILPFRTSAKNEKPLSASTIRFPASALGTQSLVDLVQAVAPNRTIRQNTTVEVRISDVVPAPLDTVFVSVDVEAIRKLDDMRKRYGGGTAGTNSSAKRAAEMSASEGPHDHSNTTELRQRSLIMEALENIHVVHTGDMLPLELTHPVTHAPAPPARVLACEPVSQGLLTPSTKIVLVPASERQPNALATRPLMSPRLAEETEDDTSNEAFYSATEDNSPMKPIVTSKSTTDLSNTDDLFDSSTEESNLSDDSDDMISLAKPGLTDQPSGLSSAHSVSTQRPFGARTGGVSTPGSVFSNVTASTIRGGQSARTKVFRTQGLLEPIPNELLHPPPAADEDEEARVYIDGTAFTRLGCFSGAWVKLEAAENSGLPHMGAFGMLDDGAIPTWRPVKVYSLPESMSKKPPKYQINVKHGRRDSISSLATTPSAAAIIHMSPILLANLKQPEHVSISPLATSKQRPALRRTATQRPSSSAPRQPPMASEVTLRKIVTPLSSERALNTVLFANLKEHFERKQRVVKAGDLIAIPVDEGLGRALYDGSLEQDDNSSSALLTQWQSLVDHSAGDRANESRSVAWFSIESVNVQAEECVTGETAESWTGAATIDPKRMTMRQSGDERRRLPSTTQSTWPYYLGVRKVAPKVPGTGAHGLLEAPTAYVSGLQRRLRELISISMSPRAMHLGLPPLALLLTSTQRSIGKAYALQRVCADLGVHYFAIDGNDVASEGGTGVDTQGLLEARCERALECGTECTVICVKHIEVLNSDRIAKPLKDVLQRARVLVATTTDIDKLSDSVRGLFTHELEMTAPDEGEREGILRDILTGCGVPLAPEVDLAAIAVKTAALVAGDLVDVVDRAIAARKTRLDTIAQILSRTTPMPITIKDLQLAGGAAATSLTPADFDTAVDQARKNFAGAISAPKIPNVQWSDVGGLTHVKDAVMETIQLPLSRPELFAKGLKKRSGILFYGPPGTGKTLLAKAIATEFSLNFFSVKGPELLNMYIGESEANVRRVFQRARDARPCVVFFDELDSVAPKRGNQGDSGGVMDRIVSQLLAELDGMSDGEDGGGGVFVIGATNRPDLLDQALLRPGRFDKMLYLGISDTHEKQATILQALTRKFNLDPALSLARVAETLPFTFTGADLYALCSDAMLNAVTRSARLVDGRLATINKERAERGQNKVSVAYYFDHYATDADTDVMVTEDDFHSARAELVPSVSLDELRHYERVRDTFEGATKTSDEVQSAVPARPVGSERQGHPHISRKLLAETLRRMKSGRGGPHNGTEADDPDGDGDDYVVRTDRLSLKSPTNTTPSTGTRNGKGKMIESNGSAEDLYD